MGGLARICKLYGRMHFREASGKEVTWVYDYAQDKPRLEAEMTKEEFATVPKWKQTKTKRELHLF